MQMNLPLTTLFPMFTTNHNDGTLAVSDTGDIAFVVQTSEKRGYDAETPIQYLCMLYENAQKRLVIHTVIQPESAMINAVQNTSEGWRLLTNQLGVPVDPYDRILAPKVY